MGRVDELDAPSRIVHEVDGEGFEGERSIPDEYVLPEFSVGMTTAEFLSEYWGSQWPEIESVLRENDGINRSLDNVNPRDFTKGRPLGTIADYFRGLKERTLRRFRSVYDAELFRVPNLDDVTYKSSTLLPWAIQNSWKYNPERKAVKGPALDALRAVIDQAAALPILRGEDLQARWEELIGEDVDRIVRYEDPIHGRSFVGPLVWTGELTQLDLAGTDGYPTFDIELTGVDWREYPNEGGFFSGVLTIWAGSDSTLRYHYDMLRETNRTFETELVQYFEALP
jgi:hypothetical protein